MKTDGIAAGERASASRRASRSLVAFLFLAAALAPLVSVPAPSSAAIDWTLSADIAKKPASVKLSALDRGSAYELWSDVLVTNYGVTARFVRALYDRGYDYGDVAMLMEDSRAAKKEPEDVAPYRLKGLGWGAIAKKLGVHPASLERAKGNESLFRRYTLARCLANYHKLPDDGSFVLLNEKGYGFDEIVLAANVSAHAGVPLRTVVAERQSGMKWRSVVEKHNMSPAKLGAPPTKSEPGKAKASSKSQGKK